VLGCSSSVRDDLDGLIRLGNAHRVVSLRFDPASRSSKTKAKAKTRTKTGTGTKTKTTVSQSSSSLDRPIPSPPTRMRGLHDSTLYKYRYQHEYVLVRVLYNVYSHCTNTVRKVLPRSRPDHLFTRIWNITLTHCTNTSTSTQCTRYSTRYSPSTVHHVSLTHRSRGTRSSIHSALLRSTTFWTAR
jgi:hypothetical protein